MRKIWIAGANGRIGEALQRLLDVRRYEVLTTDYGEVDVSNRAEVEGYANLTRPDVIINAASLSNEARCDENPDEAYRINAIGARNLAMAAQEAECKLIAFSTGDVFDGMAQAPINEFEAPNPQSVFSKSKMAGERMIYRLCREFVIIRSTWVYGTGKDFVGEVLRAADRGEPMRVSVNHYASPTSAFEMAKVFSHFIEEDSFGTYHAVCQGSCSQYEFASEILKLSGKRTELIPIGEDEGSAREYRVLDNMMLRLEGIEQPCDWKKALAEYLERRA